MALVTLRAYRDPLDADLAKARLDSAGIPAFVFDQHLVGIYWLYSRAIGGVKVKVEASDLERATQILDEDLSAELEEELGSEAEETELCPACGSDEIFRSRVQRNAAAISLLTSLPFVGWRRAWICSACRHFWRPPKRPRAPFPAETLAAEQQVRESNSHPLLRALLVTLLVLSILYWFQTRS